jgi:hypothetical protein
MKTFERRYHASWVLKDGPSALAKLGTWMVEHRATLQMAPCDLLEAAAIDVARRLPGIAAHGPTRRHRHHFAWLLRWHQYLVAAIGDQHMPSRGSARDLARIPDMEAEL